MIKDYEDVLKVIFNKATDTNDDFVISCDIGVREDQRKRICTWLTENGYIQNCSCHGQKYVQCQITEKTKQHFRN